MKTPAQHAGGFVNAMLRTLRKLFEPETAPPQTGGGKLTLRDVLLRGWDELWYQPKIELRTKRLVGAEGLLRARRPDGSIVPPGDFLPGAKEEEMLALTERVIITALRDFEDCAVQGASVKLSVNVPVSALVKLPLRGCCVSIGRRRRIGRASSSK